MDLMLWVWIVRDEDLLARMVCLVYLGMVFVIERLLA